MTAPQITKVLNPPLISDSVEDFNIKAFQTVNDLNPMMTEVNTVATYINTKSGEVAANVATAAGAAAAANTATTKASEAAASALAADASKTAAATSATSASGSASTATTQATAASNSATAAAGSATSANTAKTAAETAATNAGNSASTASTKATEAGTAATAAGNSATAAAGSATSANTAKTAAETARDDAQTARTQAQTAATNAGTSATNAANSAAAAAQSAADAEAIATGDLLANTAPEALGTSAVGDSARAARANHVHPMPTATDVGAAPAAHVGSGGAAHADATASVSGFMSAAQFNKLAGIAASANNYTHPSGDGNLHVPATGTGNNGKVLKAGATAGSISWGTLTSNDVGAEPAITTGTTSQYWRGDKTWQDFAAAVRGSVLTGLSLATNAAVTAADSVLSAIGKLQKQISDHFANTSNPHGVTAAQVGAAPAAHVGSGGAAHANATTSTSGFMSDAQATKLEKVERSAYVTVSGGTIDLSLGDKFVMSVSGNVTVSLTNAHATYREAILLEVNYTSGVITWPSAIKFKTAPSFTASKRTWITLYRASNGTDYVASVSHEV